MVELCHRTVGGRRLLRPIPALTALVLGVIGRALSLYPVELHAFVYLSNHAHYLLSVPTADVLAAFQRYVKTNTSLAAKQFVDWTGPVWSGSSVVPVLDDVASVQRLRYVLSNSVKEGLVESPLEWPGASGAAALLDGRPIPATWRVAAAYHGTRAARRAEPECPITLTPLPCWQSLDVDARRDRAAALIAGVVAAAKLDRGGVPPLGIAGVLACDPLEPVELDESPAPLCHTTDPALRAWFADHCDTFITEFAGASRRFRGVPPAMAFPVNSFPPAPAFLRSSGTGTAR